jgi:hypothetical protein
MKRWHLLLAALVMIAAVAQISWQSGKRDEVMLRWLAQHPYVIAAVRAHNGAAARWPAGEMERRDRQWRAEMAGTSPPMLGRKLLGSTLSRWLAGQRQSSLGFIDQIMVFGRNGALIAAARATHDYDQRDEPKWQETVGKGGRAMVLEGEAQANCGLMRQKSLGIIENDVVIGGVMLVSCAPLTDAPSSAPDAQPPR